MRLNDLPLRPALRWAARLRMLLCIVVFASLVSTGRNRDALVALAMAASFLLDFALVVPALVQAVRDGRLPTRDADKLADELIAAGKASGAMPGWWAWQEEAVSAVASAYAGFVSPGHPTLAWIYLAFAACGLTLHVLVEREDKARR